MYVVGLLERWYFAKEILFTIVCLLSWIYWEISCIVNFGLYETKIQPALFWLARLQSLVNH